MEEEEAETDSWNRFVKGRSETGRAGRVGGLKVGGKQLV